MVTSIVLNSLTTQVRSTHVGEEPDPTNADNITNCNNTPKHVVDVLGEAV